ncbi:GHMP kinases C terminal [Musa troglodytarum]|uniref:GHMP kinases C terminal n=1 Tax=Musa troglodytarum TaxID=320322 RepID=A0A9E7GV84_9LILI|nr:GHMP kinases C terminal [Musa troglodytarum]
MVASSWPSLDELDAVRNKVAEMSGADGRDVRVVVSPYRICPLGAHIDHQGGTVTAMTINMGILLGFVPSPDAQFLFFLDRPKLNFRQGITGFICGSEEHSSGLSSSAASILKPNLAKRALHYFSENKRVKEGLEAWASGNLDEFGKLISASGRSSIENYECGCKEMIDLYEILLKAPGVFGARFSGAGFRGCCLALVDADLTDKAAAFVKQEYQKVQPELASKLPQDRLVLICEPGDSAHVV